MISLQILRLIPLSQIWKYHGCARPQITNPHFLYVKSAKISNPQTFWFIKSANWKSTNHPKMKHLYSKVRSLNQSIFMLYLGAGKLYFRRFPVFESAIANPKTLWFKKFVEVADLLQMFKFQDPIFWQYFKTFEKKLTIIGHKSLPNLRICGISRLEHKEICGLTIKIFRFAISTQFWAHVNIFFVDQRCKIVHAIHPPCSLPIPVHWLNIIPGDSACSPRNKCRGMPGSPCPGLRWASQRVHHPHIGRRWLSWNIKK